MLIFVKKSKAVCGFGLLPKLETFAGEVLKRLVDVFSFVKQIRRRLRIWIG